MITIKKEDNSKVLKSKKTPHKITYGVFFKMNINNLHKIFLKYPNICTDSRKVKSNSIFFAIKGEKFNGNKFAKEALKKGCEYAIVDEEIDDRNEKVILVEDCLQTLQNLLHFIEKN